MIAVHFGLFHHQKTKTTKNDNNNNNNNKEHSCHENITSTDWKQKWLNFFHIAERTEHTVYEFTNMPS